MVIPAVLAKPSAAGRQIARLRYVDVVGVAYARCAERAPGLIPAI